MITLVEKKITAIDEIHIKCNPIIGSTLSGNREQVLFSSASVELLGFKKVCEPDIVLFKK